MTHIPCISLRNIIFDAPGIRLTIKSHGNFTFIVGYSYRYISTGQFTQKSDVYGFGVVLLEIICGRKPLDHTLPEEEIDLLRWVKDYVAINETPGKMVKIIDKDMDGKYDMKSITMVAKLALRCVEHTPCWRPSMSEVVGELKEAFMYEKVKLKKVAVVKPIKIQE